MWEKFKFLNMNKAWIIVLLVILLLIPTQSIHGDEFIFPRPDNPFVLDPNLIVEEFVTGLNQPTSMTFVGSDILVLEKPNGKVRLIRDGFLENNAVLDVSVSNNSERGMLGIESIGNTVYLFYTESLRDGGAPIANRIYKYTWDGTNLINPILMRELPATPVPHHNGGVLTVDLNNNVFAINGDLDRNGVLQNFPTGSPDDTSIILQVDPPGPNIAMGIRNSFGLTADPLTGNIWQTENGPQVFDEVNLVSVPFNSGWEVIMGPATQEQIDSLPGFENFVYSDPEFSWEDTIGVTSISFVDSEHFQSYSDSVLVGDCNNGKLYKFKLSAQRDSFIFSDPNLTDLVLDIGDDPTEIEFGGGFGCLTDIEVGPDGFLYIVSIFGGNIYRILPDLGNGICALPSDGDWIIISSCTLNSNFSAPDDVIVKNNSVLTIPAGLTLDIDFVNNFLKIEFESGVRIKSGGAIT